MTILSRIFAILLIFTTIFVIAFETLSSGTIEQNSSEQNSSNTNSHVLYVIEHKKNEFGESWIYKNNREYCMSFLPPGSDTVQACMNLDSPNEIVFDTYKLMLFSMFFNPTPKKTLLLGLGGGMITRALSNISPEAEQDVVEINPSVVEYNKKYFELPDNSNIRIHTMDAMDFVKNSLDGTYDMIWMDIFNEEYIPMQFLTHEFISELKRISKDSAILIFNTHRISKDNLKKYFGWDGNRDKELFGDAFDYSISLNSPTSSNVIFISFKGKIPKSDDVILNSQILSEKFDKIGIKMSSWLNFLLENMNKKL